MTAYEIITILKTDFAPKAMVVRFKTLKLFMTTIMEEHGSIVDHVAKMSDYIQYLIAQGHDIPNKLVIDRVLHSLPPSYHEFVMYFLTQEVSKSLPKLFEMLRITKTEVKEEHAALKVNKAVKWKPKRNGTSAASTSKATKSGPKPGVECFYCKGDGH